MSDLAATFDAHVQAEFQNLDLEATMATMTDDPYVHHVPTITGGNGTADVRDFYGHHFIGQWPDDTEIQPISRTVGQDQVVDEMHMTFTHDRVLDIMLPGIESHRSPDRGPGRRGGRLRGRQGPSRAHLLGPGHGAGAGGAARSR